MHILIASANYDILTKKERFSNSSPFSVPEDQNTRITILIFKRRFITGYRFWAARV